ncbi:MAG: hypothetical protein IJ608_04005 [Lachnospiraceae bacterium]|nr:hypothetical protein [Lachnospiraceae bacterium]
MKKGFAAAAVLAMSLYILAGCGEKEHIITENSIEVAKDGKLTVYKFTEFSENYDGDTVSYYEPAELKSMIENELSEFNSENGYHAVIDEVENVEGGQIRLKYEFEDYESYNLYNNLHNVEALYPEYYGGYLYYGEYVGAGEISENSFGDLSMDDRDLIVDVEDSTDVTIDKLVGRHIIVTDENIKIYAPYKVTYVTAGTFMDEDGSVNCMLIEGRKVIVMNK